MALAALTLSMASMVNADEPLSTDVTLTADTDWRSKGTVTIPAGVTVNLNGHSLKLAGLVGTESVDLTTTDAWRASSTTEFFSGTTVTNLFNNNFTRVADNLHRIIVKKEKLPLVVDYDFGEGNEQVIDQYKVYCGSYGGEWSGRYIQRCPKSWTFEGSNDKSTWKVLDSRPAETDWTISNLALECRTKTFVNTTPYRYYRFKVTAAQDDTDGYLEIVQLEYFTRASVGKLHLDIPKGVTMDSRNVVIADGVRLVKEGAGTFVANKANQTYLGGTQVSGGQLTCGTPMGLGTGDIVAVDSDGVFELNGCGDIIYSFVLNGGTLQNAISDVGEDTAQIALLRLTAPSTFKPTCSYGLIGSRYAATTLDLAGHTLTVSIGDDKKFYLFNTTVTAGTLDVSGDGWLVVDKTAFNASAANLRVNCALDIRVPSTVGSYEALYTGNNDAGAQPFTVTGTFKPHSSRYHGVILADGATLDISKCTAALDVVSSFAGQQLTFAPDATVTLDLGDRRVPGGSKVVAWDVKPENLQLQQFNVKANGRNYYMAFGDDGIYVKSGLAIYVR